MKQYQFTLKTTGCGATPDEAWRECVSTILHELDEFCDPENVPDYQLVGEAEKEDGGHDDENCPASC
jgi:hypothetical protein